MMCYKLKLIKEKFFSLLFSLSLTLSPLSSFWFWHNDDDDAATAIRLRLMHERQECESILRLIIVQLIIYWMLCCGTMCILCVRVLAMRSKEYLSSSSTEKHHKLFHYYYSVMPVLAAHVQLPITNDNVIRSEFLSSIGTYAAFN